MPALNKINLVYKVTAPRADLLDDAATQVALSSLGAEYTIKSLDFNDVMGTQTSTGAWEWTATVRVVADHV